MKPSKILIQVFFFLLFSVNISVLAQNKTAFIDSQNKIKFYETYKKGNQAKYSEKSSYTYDIKYHRLKFEIDPAVYYIKGEITTYFEAKEDNFSQISFDLASSLSVDSIIYHEIELTYSTVGNEIIINLPTPLNSNILDSLTVFYQGAPGQTGFGSFTQSSHNGSPIVWTLSEPYGAMDWWPCKQSLTDKADSIDVIVSYPEGNKAASNGILISEVTEAGTTTSHWAHKHPITAYLIAISVTNYSSYSDFVSLTTGEEVEVLNYVFPEDLGYSQANTPNVLPVIQLYSDLFIPYPFANEKYGHAQFGWGGGMEHQTMSFMNGFSFSLMAHELAHQWFGDYVTCGSWGDIWLNEGFATYLDAMTVENGLYYGDYTSFKELKQSYVSYITQSGTGSVFCDDTTSVNRIFNYRLTYIKGAMLVHMLRKKVGDEAFFNGLKNYLTDPQIANGYAHLSDLQAHMEASSTMNLDEFFNDWYYGQGHPVYSIIWSQNTAGELNLRINQSPTHSSVSFFEIGVPIKIEGVSKDTTIIFDNTYSGELFTRNIDFDVVNIIFDPESDLIASGTSIVNIDTFEGKRKCTISPNPAKNDLKITFLQKINPGKIIITDINGKTILEKSNTKGYQYIFNIDISTIRDGIYFVSFTSGKDTITKKFIKQK